jgi:hypothetical protein
MHNAAALRHSVLAAIHDSHPMICCQCLEDKQRASRGHPRQGHRRLFPPEIEIVVPKIRHVAGSLRDAYPLMCRMQRSFDGFRKTSVDYESIEPKGWSFCCADWRR